MINEDQEEAKGRTENGERKHLISESLFLISSFLFLLLILVMKELRRLIEILVLCCVCLPMAGQEKVRESEWQDIYNAMSDFDDYDEEEWREIQDIFTNLAQSPQNINTVTYEDLLQIPLLTDRQRQDIMRYRALYGDIRSMSELTLITSLDQPRQTLLRSIFYAAPTSKEDYWKKRLMTDSAYAIVPDSLDKSYRKRWHYGRRDASRHSLLFTMNIPAYEREGYKDGTYRGSNLSHTLRYRYSHGKVTAAFTAAQDAGEPFFSGTNKAGWDFYTGYFRMKNLGRLTNLVVGHYQMSLGMGLILNTDYRLSRTSLLYTSPSAATVLRGHSSRQQHNLLQGAAATIAIPLGANKNLSFTPFASYRRIDATPASDIPGAIRTILTSGYHRTDSEIARRDIAAQTTAGLSATYSAAPFRISLNMLYTALSDSLAPNRKQAYQRFRPSGKRFLSASLSYSYINAKLHISGETALSERSHSRHNESSPAVATANSIRYKITQDWDVFALQRYYSYRFQSITAKTFGDMSSAQNESGIYVGAAGALSRSLTLSMYTDFVYHPWARYGYDRQSRTFDMYLMATYSRRNTTATLRYRYREQVETDDASVVPAFSSDIDGTAQHTLRMTAKHVSGPMTYMTQLHGVLTPTSSDSGFAVLQGVGYRKGRMSLWASAAYFNSTDYAARMYLTDRSVTYGSTVAMVYGHGARANLLAQMAVTDAVTAGVRCGMLRYFDRDTISSGAQAVSGNMMTDFQVQIGIKI